MSRTLVWINTHVFKPFADWIEETLPSRLVLLLEPLIMLPVEIENKRLKEEHNKLMSQLKAAQAETARLEERKRVVQARKEALLNQVRRMVAMRAIQVQQMAELDGTSAALAA